MIGKGTEVTEQVLGPHDDGVGADLDELLDAGVHAVALDERDQRAHERRPRGDGLGRAGVERGLVVGDLHDRRGGAAAGAIDELDGVTGPGAADAREVVVLVASYDQLAGHQRGGIDEDPHDGIIARARRTTIADRRCWRGRARR